MQRRRRLAGVVLSCVVAAALAPVRAVGQDTVSAQDSVELDRRVAGFLATVRSQIGERVAGFFPTTGEFTYVHTLHGDGPDSVTTRHFPSSLAREHIVEGILRGSFDIDHHGQPIGLFLHQLILRGSDWRRVSPTRFVPPRADASSPIFLEWRKEGDVWVVSAFGDERFTRRPFPEWCC